MKNILLIFTLIFTFVGCGKKEVKDISIEPIFSKIETQYPIDNSIKEDLKNQNIAERYGISPNDIEEGIVYYTKNDDSADKIILLKAKDKAKIEAIERSISAEIVGMSDSWKDNEEEAKKIDKHKFKTKEKYVIYCVSDNVEEIVEIFDNYLNQ